MTAITEHAAERDAGQHTESVVDVLRQVVRENPDRAALRALGEEITYAEMWDRAGRIAGALRPFRESDPPHVALLLEQGIDAIVTIVGVLRAGMAFVALDPLEPAERLRFICDDVGAAVLLTNVAHASLAIDVAGGNIPILDVTQASAGEPDSNPPEPDGYDRALIVYTSGSTGQPKGVIQDHRNEIRYSISYADKLGIRPGSRLSMLFSLSFGATNTGVFGGLLRGATLCLYETRRRGVDGLPAWINDERIEVLHAVPTVFRFVADHAPEGGYPSVRTLELAGEPTFRSDVRKARAVFSPEALVVNRYAATEITIVGQHVTTREDEIDDAALPAGISPDWVDLLISDDAGAEVPPGEVGEIVVRSDYLSPGYWHRPELTARAFTVDADAPGLRRYRTGDAGRRDAQGILTVLGRIGSRVKIRGQSIEPAEVEAALGSLPGVAEAVIDVEREGEGASAEARLIAYVVMASAAEPGPPMTAVAQELRSALADRLPAHMLPARIRVVASFPQTRTGKVDRLALRMLPDDAPGEPLATDMERRLAAIYGRILGVPVLSRDDDFFALGGTSLTLAQLQTDVRREIGGDLDLEQVIRSATVGNVAAALEADPARARSQLLVPLRSSGAGAPVFLIHGWHGQAFATPSLIDAIPDQHPVYSVRARGLVDGGRPHRTVKAMADEYLQASATVTNGAQPILVGVCAGGVIAAEMASRARMRGEGQMPVIMLNAPYPPQERPLHVRLRFAALDVASGPLGIGPMKLVRRYIERRLRRRAQRLGENDLDAATIESDAAVKVALSVVSALRRHRPSQYDGPVFVIANKYRLRKGWANDGWRRILTGRVEVISAGAEHGDMLDPTRDDFREALSRAVASFE